MRDFPSCSGENGVQIADYSSSNAGKNAQNLVICIYRCHIRGRSCLITVTWTKNLMGQCVTVGVDDSIRIWASNSKPIGYEWIGPYHIYISDDPFQLPMWISLIDSCNRSLCKVEIKPWLFTKRKGSKNLEAYSCNIDVFWDLSSARFGSSPEPLGGFYVGVVVDKEIVLILGDMKKEALKKTNAAPSSSLGAVFIAKKEHIFGKRTFATKAQFSSDGKTHDLVIECDTRHSDPCLIVRVDGKRMLQVKRLHWKFRGNDTIVVNRISVEILWDVHSWFFGMPSSAGNAVFMFRSCQSVEKTWSFTQVPTSSKSQNLGFSLILYAWKND